MGCAPTWAGPGSALPSAYWSAVCLPGSGLAGGRRSQPWVNTGLWSCPGVPPCPRALCPHAAGGQDSGAADPLRCGPPPKTSPPRSPPWPPKLQLHPLSPGAAWGPLWAVHSWLPWSGSISQQPLSSVTVTVSHPHGLENHPFPSMLLYVGGPIVLFTPLFWNRSPHPKTSRDSPLLIRSAFSPLHHHLLSHWLPSLLSLRERVRF